MIHVVATIDLSAGTRDQFLATFRELVPLVLAEVGCLEYGPTVDVDSNIGFQAARPDTVTVIEKWESLEALERHLMAPHMNVFRQDVKEMVANIQLQIFEPA